MIKSLSVTEIFSSEADTISPAAAKSREMTILLLIIIILFINIIYILKYTLKVTLD